VISAFSLLTVSCTGPKPKGPKVQYGPYQNLYLSGFRRLREPSVELIRQAGTPRLYPVAIDKVWEGCLDVISQYDAVAFVSAQSKTVVFSRGARIRTDGSGKHAVYCDTVLAVTLQQRGEQHTAVYTAWLPPRTLSPQTVPMLPDDFEWEKLGKANSRTRRRWVTSIVTEEFLAQLTTQLLYEDRWKDKFSL